MHQVEVGPEARHCQMSANSESNIKWFLVHFMMQIKARATQHVWRARV